MLVGWLGLALFPGFFQACSRAVGAGWRSLGLGVGVLAGVPIVIIVAAITLVGIPASLMLLAGLFLWKNSLVFIPPLEPRKEDFIAGKEAFTGFVNLLRRNIRKRDLLDICFAEWEKSFRKNVKQTSAKYSRAESIVQAHKAGPQNQNATFGAYRELCQLLKKI